MDLSKLPRMSQTPPPPPATPASTDPAHADAPAPPIYYSHYDGAPVGAQVWISIIFGVIFLMLGWNFARYLASFATGRVYETGLEWGPAAGEKAGTAVSYPQLQGHVIWNDSAMFVFGLALVLEAAALIALASNWRLQRPLIMLAFGVALVATIYNLIVAGIFLRDGIPPIYSLVAAAFGGLVAMYLWRLLPRRYDNALR